MALRAYSAFVAAWTFFLVIAGGMVTSTGSGLAVPDWPLSFGQVFPKMEGGVFYEHGHRMIAATAGALTVVLAIWIWRQAEEPLLRKAGWIAVGLVVIQGALGGITVLLKLPTVTSVAHACLGQIYFSWMCCIMAMVWSDRLLKRYDTTSKVRRLALLTTGFVFLQLLFGAIYRHTGLLLHVHFLGAALVLIHAILIFRRIKQSLAEDPWFAQGAALLMALICTQLLLGIYTWQRPSIGNATSHVAVGALIFATTAVLSLQSFRRAQT